MPDPNATNVGGIGGIFASIFDLLNAANGQGTNRGNTAAAMSDPFMAQREGYQKQLLGLMNDPSTFKMDPGAIFARDQGLEGVARYGNAMFGTTRSGNTADTLNRDATGYAGQQYNQRINQLMTLSGATVGSPAAAGEQYIRGNQANDQNWASGAAGIGNLLGLLTGLSGNGAGGSMMNMIKSALGMGGGTGGWDFSNWNGNDFVNSDGTINLGDVQGSGDQGGFIGDSTDPSQGFGSPTDWNALFGGDGSFDWNNIFGDSGGLGLFDAIAGP